MLSSWLRSLKSTPRGRCAARLRPQVESLETRCQPAVYRSIDGTGNNFHHPQWGSTDEQLLRVGPAEYGDGISTPAGADRLGARVISNALVTHSSADTPTDRNLTPYIYIWGQFLDHDMDLTTAATPAESFGIPVPAGDPYFDPNSTGTQVIPLMRSVFDPATGTSTGNPREQINLVTSWIDGSMVYGSDTTRAAALRTGIGGRLKVMSSAVGDLPPLNTLGLPNANDAHRAPDDQLFLAGDVRSNENIELTSMHTLFLREHNRLAAQIAAANPGLNDEEIYQRARAMVIAEIQVVTYKEWLPALIGSGALRSYRGYKANVDPAIANEFSTAVFRLHSAINDDVEFFDNDGRPIEFTYVNDLGQTVTVDGEISLADAFFNPTLFKQTGVDGILKYAASSQMEEIDNQLVDSLRNFLFGAPGQGGLDLASLNIQRGRDHGLADYNATRAAYGLPRVTSFAQITSDEAVQQQLEAVYGNVDNIDLWVGALAEDHCRGASVGPLTRRVLAEQFERLRDGDRFWYQRAFSGSALFRLERTTLADIIERNTSVEGLQNNVFVYKARVEGTVFFDRNSNGRQDRHEGALRGMRVELLNDAGEVVATTLTNRSGRYSFDQFAETGDYQVRLILTQGQTTTGPNPRAFLISAGDEVERINFGVRLSARAAAANAATTPTEDTATVTAVWMDDDNDNSTP